MATRRPAAVETAVAAIVESEVTNVETVAAAGAVESEVTNVETVAVAGAVESAVESDMAKIETAVAADKWRPPWSPTWRT